MQAKISLILNLYNEATMLEHLDVVLRHVDEAIVIEGSPIGPSIDATVDIIKAYQKVYNIKLIQGTFRRHDGGYAQSRMRNILLDNVSGDFVMVHHADLVYDDDSMIMIREAIEKYPDKAVFYTPMREFFFDMRHIRLYCFEPETCLHRPLCGDVPIVSMKYRPRYHTCLTTGLSLHESWTPYDALFMPDVRRYHLCFVAPFAYQVEKHVRRITQRDWGDKGEGLLLAGFEAVFKAAVDHVESYPEDASMFDFFGTLPSGLKDKTYCAFDGRPEFYENIEKYKTRLMKYYDAEYYQSDRYEVWGKDEVDER